MSELFKEVEKLPSFHRVNTMANHLQTDGLIKRCNRTLMAMLVKTTKRRLLDWDCCLSYVLFPYRTAEQSTLDESSTVSRGRKKLADLRKYGSELAI